MHRPAQTEACLSLERLDRYVSDGCTDRSVERHLAKCATCSRQFNRILENESFLARIEENSAGLRASGATHLGNGEIEGYEVSCEISSGAQGAVYKAVQQTTGRTVALKVLLHGALATSRQRRRFEREVELIARLQHPNIVPVLDSGIHAGRYYYAMDYIDGRSLSEAMPPGRCSSRDILRVMATIAEAIDYAHQRGVLHRDLKPNNILLDGRGDPRIVDFGLGRALDSEIGDNALPTISEPGALLGTLGYMAPEQALGDRGAVSVRSDVYALGAIAYKLITGKLPIRSDGPLNEVLDRIAHNDPPSPASIRGNVDTDLCAILLKSLEKSPPDRYATAGELAADMRRYLRSETIIARRAGLPTRIRRWVRRHRQPVAIGASAAAMLAVFLIVVFIRVRDERDRARLAEKAARLEARHATQASDFLIDMLGAFDYDRSGAGATISVAEVLERGAMDLESLDDPLTRARVKYAVGTAYKGLGIYDRAAEMLEGALEIQDSQLEPGSVEIGHTANALGGAYHAMGEFDDAARMYKRALAVFRSGGAKQRLNVAVALSNLGSLFMHQFADLEEAAPLLEESLTILRQVEPHRVSDLAATLRLMGELREKQGRNEEAMKLMVEAIDMLAHVGKTENDEFARLLRQTGWLYVAGDNPHEAEARFQDALSIIERRHGPEHPQFAATLGELALVRLMNENLTGAEAACRRALEIQQKLLGPEHQDIAQTMNTLAGTLKAEGLLDEAERICRSALEMRQRLLGPEHPETAISLLTLSDILVQTGRLSEAETLCQNALVIRRKSRPSGHRDITTAEQRLARIRALLEESGGPALP